MNKLSDLINDLDFEDVLLIKKDLEHGRLKKIINSKIEKERRKRITYCPVCSAMITEGSGFHLQFGPEDLRKKATFDGIDCMQYFLERLRRKK